MMLYASFVAFECATAAADSAVLAPPIMKAYTIGLHTVLGAAHERLSFIACYMITYECIVCMCTYSDHIRNAGIRTIFKPLAVTDRFAFSAS